MTDSRYPTGADPYSDWDAAYVLGALSAAERREFEQHKDGCQRCSRAVEELAGMPGLLAAVPREQLSSGQAAGASSPVPPGVLSFLESSVQSRRRRKRWQLGAAGGVLVAAAIAAIVSLGVGRADPRSPGMPLAQLVSSPLHAQVRLAAEPWGTRLDVTCTYDDPPAGSSSSAAAERPLPYQLIVIDKAGNDVAAGGWQAGPGSTVWPTGSVDVPLNDIAKVQIRSGGGFPLLQLTR